MYRSLVPTGGQERKMGIGRLPAVISVHSYMILSISLDENGIYGAKSVPRLESHAHAHAHAHALDHAHGKGSKLSYPKLV